MCTLSKSLQNAFSFYQTYEYMELVEYVFV